MFSKQPQKKIYLDGEQEEKLKDKIVSGNGGTDSISNEEAYTCPRSDCGGQSVSFLT